MTIWPLVATHTLVAAAAWINGRIAGQLGRRPTGPWPPRPDSVVIDLTAHRPYDWTVDGDAHGPVRGCPRCHWRGWVTIPDWALDPLVVDLVIDCPDCTKVPR